MSYEDFLVLPDECHMEWVDGVVYDMGEITIVHAQIARFVVTTLSLFAEAQDLGEVLYEPVNMKLPGRPSGRSPDVLFIARTHLDRLRERHLEGPADLVVEVISPSSATVDRIDKFEEYEAGGVPEYWIIDPVRELADFYVLGERGLYVRVEHREGVYESRQLPGFRLRVDWLWSRPRVRDIEAELGIV
jgi:Uma2 family endonuclease